ncbi:HET-domain-containing protein [Didymella exigua CBS 183.55]|uniref:HET-domain-containing protein n=1 Tax=Didymella exigua CBS 183.55 TaxID=1150837 RepID=A0A6A5RG64_9PLEO|nr:HET-domain-containing protein [Didymella exigua CBS 183.55]KAF1924617.1 HET-domain-containing protein [Didymella exigua CBS 183.55]
MTDRWLSQRQAIHDSLKCLACELLPFDALAEDRTPPPTTIDLDSVDIEGLRKRAAKCDFCRALVDLREHWLSEERENRMPDDGFAYHNFCGMSDWRMKRTDHTYLGLNSDFDSVLAKRINDRYIYSDPLSGLPLKQVSHWMRKCSEKHKRCFEHPTDLPTRVIDVRSPRLKLLDPSPSNPHPYVALSHCWGTCRDFLTTRENIQDRRSGFELTDLPATFRDAVTAARILNIPFLWIDSICILQGDKDDWEMEGSKMADVYSNATMCIAAADANDDTEGFLRPRKDIPTLAIDIVLTLPTPNQAQMKTRIYTQLPLKRPGLHERFPALHNRAWCLQERYLSPRILFFDRDNMHWECLEDVWSEAGRRLPKHRQMLPDIMPRLNKTEGLSHTPWCRMVREYTTRAISFPSDKLPAVSALALRIAQKTGDGYCAGLWKSDLLRGLLWYRAVRYNFRAREAAGPWNPNQQRPQSFLAPSWSWASYLGAVDFLGIESLLHILPSAKLIDASVVVPGRNKFGEVDRGYVTILSPLLTFEEQQSTFDTTNERKYGWTHDSLVSRDTETDEVTITSCFDYPNETRQGWLLGIPLVYKNIAERQEDSDGQEGQEDQKYCSQDTSEQPWLAISGILIMEKKGDEKVYERVGCFSIEPVQLDSFLDFLRDLWTQETRIV